MHVNKTFNWGILGPGKIAHKFAQGLSVLENAKLYAVGSRNSDRALNFGKQYNVKKIYGSYEELAADKDVEIIYIASPHSEHFKHVKLCLEHGKHVLCEKAFTLNSKELIELIELAGKNRLFLMEAIWTRFLPTIDKTLEIIQSGDIGEVKIIQTDFGFKAPDDKNGRLFNPLLGGGSLLDIGIYPIFLCLLILGDPKELKALAHKGETGIDESLTVNLSYPDGALAGITSSFMVNTATRAFIYGTKGNISINSRWISQTSIDVKYEDKEPEHLTFNYRNNGYDYEAEEVMRCIEAGLIESPKLSLNFSLRLMRLMDKIREQTGIIYNADL